MINALPPTRHPLRPGRRARAAWLALVWLLLALHPVAAADDATPPQLSALAAQHRSGQTFLTWQERADLSAERYRVYRHTAPITAATLDDAQLLAEIGEGSATFFAGRYKDYATPPNWAYRYGERLGIAPDGPPLASGTGLLVWTLAAVDLDGAGSGAGYYAVTTVGEAGENRSDFGAGNTLGPVTETVALPQPVRIRQEANGWQVYL